MSDRTVKPSYPKALFIDGPNASGKDYTIEQLDAALTAKGYLVKHACCKTHLPSFIQHKRYFTYNFFNPSQIHQVLTAHMKTIDDVATLLQENRSQDTVVLINRSILTALIYNFGLIDDESTPNRIHQSQEAFEKFRQHFRSTLSAETGLLILDKYHDFNYAPYGERYVTELCEEVKHFKQKISQRAGDADKPFDAEYVRYLLGSYRRPDVQFLRLFNHCLFSHSGDLAAVLELY
ncbi:MAG: hypothetical protein PHN51_10165 [Candidatus Nanopelagicales bacterium]|nr:hypothetical protein [Candidatus Nanopelagicales bacterium]